MNYPYDFELDDGTLVFLASLRKNLPSTTPRAGLLELIEDDQPDDLKALIHTYAYHYCNGAVGDYWFEQGSCMHLRDLPQVDMMEEEQLNGFSRDHGVVYGNNAGGEFFLIATWEPGGKTFRTVQAIAGGYNDDGLFPMEGNVVEVLRQLMRQWSEKDLDLDFEWDSSEPADDEAIEELAGGDADLFALLWKP